MNTARTNKRIFAYIIDLLLCTMPVIAGAILLYYQISVAYNYNIPWYFLLVGVLVTKWVVYFILSTIILLLSNGRTVGNFIFGIKIIHSDFKHLSLKDAMCISAVHGLIIMMVINMFYVYLVHTEKSVADRLTQTIAVDYRHRSI